MSFNITSIPTELIGEIASNLSDLDHSSLRMTCKTMHEKVGAARALDEDEYVAWHKQYERYHRRTPYPSLLLLCASCMKHLPRIKFQDSKSHKRCTGTRVCIDCSIACEFYTNSYFTWKGQKRFHCFGCKKILLARNDNGTSNEGSYLAAREKAKAEAEVEVAGTVPEIVYTAEKKWCAKCWKIVRYWGVAKRNLANKILLDKERRRAARIARRAANA